VNLALNGGTPVRKEAFPSWPVWDEAEAEGLLRVLNSGKWGSLHGKEVRNFEKEFVEFQGVQFATATNSGTSALEIALRAAGIRAGDEVIVPAYTFVATATAVLANGAIPVFADIDPGTYNLDPASVQAVVSERTRAILPVHFAGRPADMEALQELARQHDLKIIEDAAQGWGARWRGQGVGAIGHIGCFSFQSSKNINAGEGGLVTSGDPALAEKAASYTNCGRVGGGLWYAHYHFAGNSRMTEFQAAVLRGQLQRYPQQLQLRQQSMHFLDERLQKLPGIKILRSDDRITAHAGHIYIFRYEAQAFDGVPKANFIDALKAEGIPCSGGYSLPLYEQPIFQEKSFGPFTEWLADRVDYRDVRLPNTHRACYDEAVWLPQWVLLAGPENLGCVAEAIEKIYENRRELRKN